MVSSEPNLRIPALLMPSYIKLTRTEEGKEAQKRVRVNCAVCREIRYYTIHRGVTRIAGVMLACEACRHYFQKFKRQPTFLKCKDNGSCYVLGDNSKNRCKACWMAHMLRICPLPADLYRLLIAYLPSVLKESMPETSRTIEETPEEERGALGLEIMKEDEWVDVTEVVKEEEEEEEEEEEQQQESSEDPLSVGREDEVEEESCSTVEDKEDNCEATNTENKLKLGQVELQSSSLDSYPVVYGEGEENQPDTTVATTRTVREIERDTLKWWMEQEEGTSYGVTGNGGDQPYYHPSEDNGGEGLTPLMPLQPTPALTTLTPLQPAQQNGFHDTENFIVKQEKTEAWCDGETQEAQLFRNISIKQEIFHHEEGVDNPNSPSLAQLSKIVVMDDNTSSSRGVNIKAEAEDLTWPKEAPLEEKTSQHRRKPRVKQEDQESKPKKKYKKNKRPAAEQVEGSDHLPSPTKQRKKFDRFNGMPEEEVAKKTLPDHLGPNMDILIIGINPGLTAAHVGHHYAGPGNHFWKCMYLSGLISEPFNAYDDFRLLEYGIGFTNIVARTTRGSSDLTKQEIKEGATILLAKVKKYKPLIAVFNGKGIYEIYSGKKEFSFGKQPEFIEGTNTHIWVMPSSSARCAQLPRALDKVPFYAALRKYRDHLKGTLQYLDEAEVVFTNIKLTNVRSPKKEVKTEERKTKKPAPAVPSLSKTVATPRKILPKCSLKLMPLLLVKQENNT